MDSVMACSSGATIRADELVGAQLLPRTEALKSIGWRIAGAYLPKAFATGWYSYKGARGARQLWCVYRDDEVLAIDLKRDRPRRVVLQHPDRARLCQQINALLDANASRGAQA
jgi:hypothetical protein